MVIPCVCDGCIQVESSSKMILFYNTGRKEKEITTQDVSVINKAALNPEHVNTFV